MRQGRAARHKCDYCSDLRVDLGRYPGAKLAPVVYVHLLIERHCGPNETVMTAKHRLIEIGPFACHMIVSPSMNANHGIVRVLASNFAKGFSENVM